MTNRTISRLDETTCEPCAVVGREPLDCYNDSRRDSAHRDARVRAAHLSGLGA